MEEQNNTYADKVGLPPGSLVYIGKQNTQNVILSEINYSADHYEENVLNNFFDSKSWDKSNVVTVVSVIGIHDLSIIESAGEFFNLDPMILEKIVNTQSRPKLEEFDDYLFLSMKTLEIDINFNDINIGHISLLLRENGVISFQENEINILDPLKDRIRQGKGIIRQQNSDYIFYRIVDTLVDNYFTITEHLADLLEELEEKILDNQNENLNEEIYDLKKKIGVVKRNIYPLRECLFNIIKSDNGFVTESTQNYFRDVYDHLIHLSEIMDSQRETINDFLNLNISFMSNKMNEVMKVLTIFASIFIPLTFIAGIYGMNFNIMPELQWEYGYFIVWGIMIAVTILLLIYFRMKRWF